jgi:hypothetical protein
MAASEPPQRNHEQSRSHRGEGAAHPAAGTGRASSVVELRRPGLPQPGRSAKALRILSPHAFPTHPPQFLSRAWASQPSTPCGCICSLPRLWRAQAASPPAREALPGKPSQKPPAADAQGAPAVRTVSWLRADNRAPRVPPLACHHGARGNGHPTGKAGAVWQVEPGAAASSRPSRRTSSPKRPVAAGRPPVRAGGSLGVSPWRSQRPPSMRQGRRCLASRASSYCQLPALPAHEQPEAPRGFGPTTGPHGRLPGGVTVALPAPAILLGRQALPGKPSQQPLPPAAAPGACAARGHRGCGATTGHHRRLRGGVTAALAAPAVQPARQASPGKSGQLPPRASGSACLELRGAHAGATAGL